MGRKQAIEQFCKECIFDRKQGESWRKQVAKCTSRGCPLYAFRPLPYPQKSIEKRWKNDLLNA